MRALFDIHCHLVPGVDDGAKTIQESIDALALEYDQGVRKIICTPHYSAELSVDYREKVLQAFEELKSRLKETPFGSEMSLYLGNEMMYTESLVDRLAEKQAYTMAGSHYVLAEFLPSVRYEELLRGLKQVMFAGYSPILAHMERYQCLVKQEERLDELADLDIYLQVNGASLFGGLFDSASSRVRKLCKAGRIDFLGTDSHGIHYRKPEIKRAAEWIEKNCGERVAEKMLYRNPQAVLDDKII